MLQRLITARLVSVSVAMLVVTSVYGRDFNYTYMGQTITYTVVDEEIKTCKVAEKNKVEGDLILPSNPKDGSINFTLVAIGKYAFPFNKTMSSITIPATVTKIESDAFFCCKGLQNIYIPDSVELIAAMAFEECSGLKTIRLPNSLKLIGAMAFSGCSALTTISIPNSVTKIGNTAFKGCVSLKTLFFEDDDNWLEFEDHGWNEDVFYECPLETVYLGRNIEYRASPFKAKTTLKNLTIGNTVTYIGSSAFEQCEGLKSVIIPNSVTEIDSSAFAHCQNLTSVTLSPSLEFLGSFVLCYCPNLRSITYLSESPKTFSSRYLLDEDMYDYVLLNYLWYTSMKIGITEPWCNFVNRVGRDADFIDAISEVHSASSESTAVYDIRGVKVGISVDGLPHGVYIIRKGSEVTKTVI